MRDDLWTLVRFLHVLGAALWVGGMIVLGAVAVPAARQAGDREAGRRVITTAARAGAVLLVASALAVAAALAACALGGGDARPSSVPLTPTPEARP